MNYQKPELIVVGQAESLVLGFIPGDNDSVSPTEADTSLPSGFLNIGVED